MTESSVPVPTAPPARPRLASLDQFRGYTVAGMFLVNFLGKFDCVPDVMKHKNTFFSYADTIMPQFFFAVGFAMRLTLGRKLAQADTTGVRWSFARRCFTLVVISFVLMQIGAPARTWAEFLDKGPKSIALTILKVDLWETLALIGVTSLWLLPTIHLSALVRFAFLVGCTLLYFAFSHLFLFNFDLGLPNRLDEWMATGGRQVFDGGLFGFLTWCIPMLAGTLACDMATRKPGQTPVFSLAFVGILFMAIGYGMSCVSTLYNPEYKPEVVSKTPGGKAEFAASPVVPPKVEITKENWKKYLAEPPFTPPRPDRPWNSWMMTKRLTTPSIMVFAAGFSFAVYALFGLLSDWLGLSLGLFRTLGSNALAAYVIHALVENGIKPLIPKDAPVWYVAVGFVIFFAISYAGVRYLERNKIYIRA